MFKAELHKAEIRLQSKVDEIKSRHEAELSPVLAELQAIQVLLKSKYAFEDTAAQLAKKAGEVWPQYVGRILDKLLKATTKELTDEIQTYNPQMTRPTIYKKVSLSLTELREEGKVVLEELGREHRYYKPQEIPNPFETERV